MATKKTRTPSARAGSKDSHKVLAGSLRDAEARLRLIIDSVPAAITYFDLSKTMLSVNRFYEDLIEQRSEDLIGKKLWEIISAEEYEVIRPHVEKVLRGERAAYRRTRRRKDGSASEIQVQQVPDFDAEGKVRGAFSLVTDITELTRAEQMLNNQFHFVTQLIEAIPNPVFYKDAQGRYLGCNRAFEAYIGRPRAELIGKSVFDLSPRDLAEGYHAADQALFDKPGTQVYEASVLHADGTRHEVVFNKATFGWTGGQVAGLVGVILDVTALKRAEIQLQELNQNLEKRVRERTAELEALVREREAFSYSIAHDLRSPLGVIGSFSHLLGKDEGAKLSSEGRRQLQVIEDNTAHLVTLVDALLALAQVGRVRLERKPIDLGEIAATAAKSLGTQYPKAQILVGALPQVTGDPTLIQQVLYNLMDNALKYSARDPAPRVNVGWNQDVQACYVRDNGAGFEMRHADKLFSSFERLHSDPQIPGSGIGLAIVKRVIERHGGRVWAQSTPGRGATFYFTLGTA
jgi:PAS domain S-box-containing protein